MPITVQQGTPPARRATPKKPAGKTLAQTATSQHEARYQGLLGLGQIGSAVCVLKGWFADSGAIGLHWPNVAQETANLADQNEQIGKAIDYLNSAGPYSGLLLAILPLGMQIAANHGKIDPESASGLGVMSPDMLAAKTKANLDQQQADIMRQALEAQQAAEKAQTELSTASRNGLRDAS